MDLTREKTLITQELGTPVAAWSKGKFLFWNGASLEGRVGLYSRQR